jgi:hypothetical protein
MQVYAERYHHLKTPRKLHWQPTLGCVELEVTVGDTTLEFKVTPVHAALLLAFAGYQGSGSLTGAQSSSTGMGATPMTTTTGSSSRQRQVRGEPSAAGVGCAPGAAEMHEDKEWDVAGLSEHLGLPPGVVRTKMLFWVTNGVLLEGRGAEGQLVYRRATSIPPGHAGEHTQVPKN